MANNATKWLSHIQAVIATIGNGRYGKVNDRKTYGVLARAIPDMFTARGLDGELKDTLLTNIRIRAAVNVDHAGPIKLSRHQRAYAKTMGWDTLRSFDELYQAGQRAAGEDLGSYLAEASAETPAEWDAELMSAFQHYFSIVSASFQHQFSTVSADMPRNLAEKLDFWRSCNGMSCNVNHESQDSMIAASQSHEPAAIRPELHDGTEPPAIQPGHEKEIMGQRKGRPRKADALSIFVKERKGKLRASGNLEVGGEKVPLTFRSFYDAFEAIPTTLEAAEWRAEMASDVADVVLPIERSLSGVAARSTMSGFHAANDSYGYKAPVGDRQAVILEWDGDVPVRATIIDGYERFPVELARKSDTLFKGAIKLDEAA